MMRHSSKRTAYIRCSRLRGGCGAGRSRSAGAVQVTRANLLVDERPERSDRVFQETDLAKYRPTLAGIFRELRQPELRTQVENDRLQVEPDPCGFESLVHDQSPLVP